MPNPRNLNYVLGEIGNSLIKLGESWKETVPPIQCIVINKSTGLPGAGISWFIKNKEAFLKSPPSRRRQLLEGMLQDVFSYPHWERVLHAFKLKPDISQTTIFSKLNKKIQGLGGGESDHHRKFKDYIAKHPSVVGFPNLPAGVTEYSLPSGDAIDVVFETPDLTLGVEVKSHISDSSDILRGLFQCVKYAALLEAHNKVRRLKPNIRVCLALEGKMPAELVSVKNVLGVEVVDQIRPGKTGA